MQFIAGWIGEYLDPQVGISIERRGLEGVVTGIGVKIDRNLRVRKTPDIAWAFRDRPKSNREKPACAANLIR